MSEKTSKELYTEAFQALLKAKKAVRDDNSNPFNMNLPTHEGLPEEQFVTDEDLDRLEQNIADAASDNAKFARLWNIGTDVVIKGKALF